MEILPLIFVALVAIEHLYILVLEMFMWTKPRTLKVFGMSKEDAQTSKALATNMGLYNGFLAAGLIWGMLHPNAEFGQQIQLFFLSCVLVAAIVGGLTAKRSIMIVQGVPALMALAAVLIL